MQVNGDAPKLVPDPFQASWEASPCISMDLATDADAAAAARCVHTLTHKLRGWCSPVRKILDPTLKSELPLFTFVGVKYLLKYEHFTKISYQYLSNTEFSSFLKATFYVRQIWQISLLWKTRMLHCAHQLRLPVKCWVQQPRHICVIFKWRWLINIYDEDQLEVEVVVISVAVADPGFSRRAANPRFWSKNYYLARFLLKTAWKWKKLDQEGMCVPSTALRPPVSRMLFQLQRQIQGGGVPRRVPPMDQNFLNFMQFFWKIWKFRMLVPPSWRVDTPSYEESLIRPWIVTIGWSKGARGMRTPLGVQILSFSCSFRPKMCKIIPLWELALPQENPGSSSG